MTQITNDTKRQAIKTAKEQRQLDETQILSGIVDNDSKTYTFEAEALVDGKREKGTFVAKYMGVAARLRIGTIRAKLLDGAPAASVDVLTDDIAYIIAYLQVALIKTPKWWNYDELEDFEDLKNIYQEVFNFIQNFRAQNEQNTHDRYSSDTSGKKVVED